MNKIEKAIATIALSLWMNTTVLADVESNKNSVEEITACSKVKGARTKNSWIEQAIKKWISVQIPYCKDVILTQWHIEELVKTYLWIGETASLVIDNNPNWWNIVYFNNRRIPVSFAPVLRKTKKS